MFNQPYLQASSLSGSAGVFTVNGTSPLTYPGTNLLAIDAVNTVASVVFLQVYDGYAAPSNGAVPLLSLKLEASTDTSAVPMVNWKAVGVRGLHFVDGIVVVSSTTAATYTAGGSTDLFVTVSYF